MDDDINDKDDDTGSQSSDDENEENDEEDITQLEEEEIVPTKKMTWEQLNRKLEIKFGAKQELENLPRDEDMNLVLDFINGNKNEDENFLAELWITKFLSANPRVRRSSRILEKPLSPVPKIIPASNAPMEPPKKQIAKKPLTITPTVKKPLATTSTVVEIVDDSESEDVVVTSAVRSTKPVSVSTKELWKARFESSFSQAFYKEDPSGNR